MKTLIIMRGLPGSGKSTLTSYLEKLYSSKATICSADNYWYGNREKTPENYLFDRSKLGSAHKYCQSLAFQAMDRGDDLIIIDNTNISPKDYKVYALTAVEKNYQVIIHSITGCSPEQSFSTNVHKVPLEACTAMYNKYSKSPRVIEGQNLSIEPVEVIHDFHWIRKGVFGNGKFGSK